MAENSMKDMRGPRVWTGVLYRDSQTCAGGERGGVCMGERGSDGGRLLCARHSTARGQFAMRWW